MKAIEFNQELAVNAFTFTHDGYTTEIFQVTTGYDKGSYSFNLYRIEGGEEILQENVEYQTFTTLELALGNAMLQLHTLKN